MKTYPENVTRVLALVCSFCSPSLSYFPSITKSRAISSDRKNFNTAHNNTSVFRTIYFFFRGSIYIFAPRNLGKAFIRILHLYLRVYLCAFFILNQLYRRATPHRNVIYIHAHEIHLRAQLNYHEHAGWFYNNRL